MLGMDSASQPGAGPGVIWSMLHWRRTPAALYRRLARPGRAEYARLVAGVVIYRAAAALAAGFAITLLAFLGYLLYAISRPWVIDLKTRPVTIKVNSEITIQAINTTTPHAIVTLSSFIPVFVLLGLILASVPRAHLWLFRITIISGIMLGFYLPYLPSFPHSFTAVGNYEPIARVIPTMSYSVAYFLMAASLIVSYLLYRRAYTYTVRSTSSLPRRPVTPRPMDLLPFSLARRLAATTVVISLFLAGLWIIQNVHLRRPDAAANISWIPGGYNLAALVLIVAIGAMAICMPRPRGHELPLRILLIAMTGYALASHVYLIRAPAWMPVSSANPWWLIAAFLFVLGFGFDLTCALLGWPIYVQPRSRKWQS